MNDSAVESVGEMLRIARESKGVTLDEANRATKISVDVLKALEQDDFDSIESDIYLKGFLKNYAGYLGIDARGVLRRLDQQRGGAPTAGGAVWDIEETLTEEKLTSPRIFRRIVAPLLIVIILVLAWLYIRERKRQTRLNSRTQVHVPVDAGARRAG